MRLALKANVDGGLLPQILDTYALEEAALPVELVLGRFGEQARMLRDGRGVDHEPLAAEPFLIAMAAADPLAALPCRACGRPTWPAGAFPTAPPQTRASLRARTGIPRQAPLSPPTARPREATRTTLSVAWPQDSHSPAVAAFARAATKVAQSETLITN